MPDNAEPARGEVLVDRDPLDESVARITLNRPDRMNALSHELLVELRTALEACDGDPGVRAVVLTGAGDRAFSAGADLRGGPSDTEQVLRTYYNPLVSAMIAARTPLIAAINGVTAGAGVSLSLACDMRIAATTASFSLAFVRVGLVPDAGATWLLPRAVGTGRAAEMALLGRKVAAEEARDWGLVNEVVATGEALERASEVARAIASLSSSTSAIRALLHGSAHRSFDAHLDAEATAQGTAQHHPDYQEARAAFAERRQPVFRR
ncbi:Enoyl-CoA hydratase [Pseudonocardia sp. Ae168_Ps1]|uniref:enoyl-CoA hydratase/isomerase family protein n=1 Tax=unclassified Pseudonocardia TaxID=2619320 RepID=UPI0009673080|nr:MULTISPECIES: enoyl-CoA hydratase-related protein [unclassified Pseudonocardia]OLL73477.1 Enoyl-CoA hydratase [Pseudonocardia sp. Ae150A_Ps1]OLL79453.1 Enoyl-CoA hydratase [Pseudonocardia sp. Ae168_Ps1]OLL86412.1 Enoyl-CoA hydratase [Pseudonocardia sp. Ae263_Ps1]OLL93547.1 Enoyl-CoA hydratase [Pseudonocardia sp. Ae356_Ps1]